MHVTTPQHHARCHILLQDCNKHTREHTFQAWDMAAEQCLMQLPTLLSDAAAEFQPSPFFSEQLTAFELWLTHGSRDKKPPEQLPIVLQVRAICNCYIHVVCVCI